MVVAVQIQSKTIQMINHNFISGWKLLILYLILVSSKQSQTKVVAVFGMYDECLLYKSPNASFEIPWTSLKLC